MFVATPRGEKKREPAQHAPKASFNSRYAIPNRNHGVELPQALHHDREPILVHAAAAILAAVAAITVQDGVVVEGEPDDLDLVRMREEVRGVRSGPGLRLDE